MKPTPKTARSAAIEAAAADWIARRDAGLSPAEQTELQQWTADPRHARALARHTLAWRILDHPRRGGKTDVVLAELRSRARQRVRRRSAAIVGVFAAVVMAAMFWRWQMPAGSASGVAHTVVVVPEKRVLPDNSVVELKAGAEITVDFSGPLRRVALRKGEAHFQVHPDKEKPFVVTAGAIEVRAVGTAFSVQWDSRQVDVLVTEGRVAVEKPTAPQRPVPAAAPTPAPFQPVVVDAGNRVVVDPHAPPLAAPPAVTPVLSAEMEARLAWRATRLEFTGTRLADAVVLMNRHNRVQFVVDDPTLANVEVSGFFRADNTDAFLHLLEGSLGLHAQRQGDTITLRKETPAGRKGGD